MPTLLLFNIAPSKAAKIHVLALRCGCRVQAVPPERQGARLEELLSGAATDTAPAEPFDEELLVMAGLDGGRLDALLDGLRRQRQAHRHNKNTENQTFHIIPKFPGSAGW